MAEITIQTVLSKIVDAVGADASGTITIQPNSSWEYDSASGRRKVSRLPIQITITNGLISDPSPLVLAPTINSGVDITDAAYIATFQLTGTPQHRETWQIDGDGSDPIEFTDIIIMASSITTPGLPVQGLKGDQGVQGIQGPTGTIDTGIAAATANLPALAYVDVAYASHRSDPAWLDRCEDKSWYTESLHTGAQYVQAAYANDAAALAANSAIVAGDLYYNSTSGLFVEYATGTTWTRASQRRMPMDIMVTAESERVIIWDMVGPTPRMWGVFLGSNSNMLAYATAGRAVSQTTMVGGRLLAGVTTTGDLKIIDFLADSGVDVATIGTGDYKGTISQRNDGLGFGGYSSAGAKIVHNTVNNVAITHLPDAPINAHGTRVPTSIVGTAAGASWLTHYGDGFDATGAINIVDCDIDADGRTLFASASKVYVYNSVPTADTTLAAADYTFDTAGTTGPHIDGTIATVNWAGNKIVVGTSTGLFTIVYNQSTPANSIVSKTTSAFNTGGMEGDIRRAYLANSKTAGRSVKGGTLVENGTVPSAVVATGADLLGYGPYSAANYFSEPHSVDFAITTGLMSLWYDASGNGQAFSIGNPAHAYNDINIQLGGGGASVNVLANNGAAGWGTNKTWTSGLPSSGWHSLVITLDGTTTSLFIDGVLKTGATGSDQGAIGTYGGALSQLYIGIRSGTASVWNVSSLALIKLSATIPTDEAIAAMYADEKGLFEANAKCLLSNSSSVSTLSYDPTTGVYQVGNGTAVDQFKGLERLSTAAHGVTTLTGLASSNGAKAIVGTGGSISKPAEDINAEMKAVQLQLAEAKQGSELYSLTSSGTTWNLPQGFTAVGPIWNITDGTFAAVAQSFDGFIWKLTGLTTAKLHNVTIRRV